LHKPNAKAKGCNRTEKDGAMAEMGRPEIEIDWSTLDKLLFIQCNQVEICGIMNISPDTLLRRCREKHGVTFAEYSEQKRQGGRMSLRRKQMDTALSGNVTMMIWLGKQYLGQKDKQETTIDTMKPIQLAYSVDQSDDRELIGESNG
jgi:hypothetical protein